MWAKMNPNWRGLTADAADLKKEKKPAHFGRIQAMSLTGRFKLDDSASNELVGVKFYDFFFLIENLKLSLAAN